MMKQKDVTVAGSLNEVLLIIDDRKEILHMDVENALEFAAEIAETAMRNADPPIKGMSDSCVEKEHFLDKALTEIALWGLAAGMIFLALESIRLFWKH